MSNEIMAKGSCLCSAVSLSTTSMNRHVAACHCSMCRKWGGGALLVVDCGSDVSFTAEENIGIYQSWRMGGTWFAVISVVLIYFTD